MIRFVPYEKIDKLKWDECIEHSSNGLIYGLSMYLDHMAANWDGLVLNDYEAVMPLTWKKKLQIKYLYQPAFIQQGGIFSTGPVTQEVVHAFLNEAMNEFSFAECTLNYANAIMPRHGLETTARTNYILPLSGSYEAIYANYDPAFTKSLRRIKKFGIEYTAATDHRMAIQLYKELYGKRLPYFTSEDYAHFENICNEMELQNNVITRLAYSPGKQLLAAVMLLRHKGRLYNMISCITPDGKKLEANYFLYDKIIEEHAGSGLILDLEGSDVKGIAAFYKKMNPVLEEYGFVKWNKLHPLIRIIKK